MIFATCATLAAALASAAPGSTIAVAPGACPAMTLKRAVEPPLTIHARGVTFRGLVVTGAGYSFRGGTYAATGGKYLSGPGGYGVLLRGARDVSFEGATFTDAKKAIVTDSAARIAVRYSEFKGVGEDGVIASNTAGLELVYNRLTGFEPLPTTCTAPDGKVTTGLASRTCVAAGGVWKDGFHADAFQFRNGVTDLLVGWNSIEAPQGIGQFDTTGDAPLARVTVIGNTVTSSGFHSITFGAVDGLVIRDNRVAGVGTTKTVLRFRAGAVACGNTSATRSAGTEACAQ